MVELLKKTVGAAGMFFVIKYFICSRFDKLKNVLSINIFVKLSSSSFNEK